ncbi:disulfide bond formation protein DsbB [Vibrio sp. JC009]|uniref:disulfide bond formation protein DsbB n=1 Tax=Vibrio sp. JC009 TaxID=2912314 RepID=UPI0023AF4750|nr:disulfide bond formation protein DsbB [Vibrio sp. JC009]WED24444.1 disulfide bond formation protein DsbB [Vibrio sp. JC009]
MNFLASLKSFSRSRLSWLLLLFWVLFFLGCAFSFQHLMLLAPCVMCIYERVAMIGIGIGAGVGLIKPESKLYRGIGFSVWGISAIKGLLLSLEHVNYQSSIFATCEALRFPSWAPLDKWIPWYFNATGDCGEIAWQFLSLSMPQWLVIIFAANLVVLSVVVIAQLSRGEDRQAKEALSNNF